MKFPVTFVRLILASAVLAGCSAHAQTVQNEPAAYVDVDRLLPQHPFYSQLRHYDEQIAALQATNGDGGPLSHAGLTRDVQSLRQDLDASANALRDIYERNGDRYAARRSAAVARILSMPVAAHPPAAAAVADSMLRTYRDQQDALRAGAARDMQRYGRELTAQQQDAYHAYVGGVENRVMRAYAMRAQQLQESEGTLALDLARKDMQQRLALQLRLRTLAMNSERRGTVARQLQQIDAREAAIVGAQRRKDEATLATYRGELESGGRADIAEMAATMQNRARTNFAGRRNVYAAQTQLANGDLPLGRKRFAGRPLDARALLNRAQTDDPARRTGAALDAFGSAGNDMLARLNATANADAGAQRAAAGQITALRAERDALRMQMREQIERLAGDVARERGMNFIPGKHAGRDLTPAVRDRLRVFNV